VSSFLLFSLGSIAQNKIAGVITDGDGKINAVEVYNKTTNIKVFTDAGAFEFDLKIRKLRFCFLQRRLPIVEQNNITTGSTLNDCAEENHQPI
jgi:Fe(3+) dicitrate transport protein